ncbi:UNVERIFIED_CONTAM: hypothetical protein FKN15_020344 [Acipenser sinensis]
MQGGTRDRAVSTAQNARRDEGPGCLYSSECKEDRGTGLSLQGPGCLCRDRAVPGSEPHSGCESGRPEFLSSWLRVTAVTALT